MLPIMALPHDPPPVIQELAPGELPPPPADPDMMKIARWPLTPPIPGEGDTAVDPLVMMAPSEPPPAPAPRPRR